MAAPPAFWPTPLPARAGTDGASSFAPAFVSRDAGEAQPGDLFLYRNSERAAHVMVYIGKSQVIPSACQWVIYLSGGSVHKVSVTRNGDKLSVAKGLVLRRDPDKEATAQILRDALARIDASQ